MDEGNLKVGVVCESTSDNLEAICFTEAIKRNEIFIKYYNKPEVYKIFYYCPFQFIKGVGTILYYRCDQIENSQILATINNKIVIRTIGEGDFVLCSPSKAHTGGMEPLENAPRISVAERNILLTAARSFDNVKMTF